MERASNHEFSDPEELSLALRHTDVTAVQTSRGPFSARLSYLQLGDWNAQRIHFIEGSAACDGSGPADRFAFIVPMSLHRDCRLLGLDVRSTSVGVYAPGSEHADTSSAGFEQIVLMPPPAFWTTSDTDVDEDSLPSSGSYHSSVSQQALNSFRSLLRRVMAKSSELGDASAADELNKSFNDELSSSLKNVIGSRAAGSDKGRQPVPRAAVMRQLTEVLDLQRGQPTYAGELARAVGVSDATLRRMFIELFGMPPARYLMIKRLYLARQALRSGRFETVGQVSEACGFWDHGRFAGRYRELFGERPIDTLRARRK